MNSRATPAALLLTIGVWLFSAHRLPAPIVEEEKPTLAPKFVATPKPKPKIAATPKPKPTPVSFAGSWGGLINSHCGDVNYSGQLALIVSPDERSITTRLEGAQSVRPCSRAGSLLQWQDGGISISLRANSDGRTAAYSYRFTYDGDMCSASGILAKH